MLTGGTQNILVRFSWAGRNLVLRRPPEHKRSNSDETMIREARILEALADSAVPHPRFFARCNDLTVIGAAFYVMEAVEGFNPTDEMPDVYRNDPAWQKSFAESLVDALLALAAICPEDVGLGDLGRADGWHDRQVRRWGTQLERYENVDGIRSDLVEPAVQIGRWLTEYPPRSRRTGLMHGDFHVANVLFERKAPQLAAIVDWELATRGDPLLDFGQLLATWPLNEHAVDVVPVGPLEDLPEISVLVERYLVGSDRALHDILWFRVLACYRLAIIIEGTYTRARAGRADAQFGDQAHARALTLFQQAMALIDAA